MLWTRNRGMEFFTGLIVEVTKDSGLMENNMELESSLTQKEF